VEYDGTDFVGFQLQRPGLRSVQGVLEEGIAAVSGRTARVHGAGRTDAGVHATGQVVHFESDWPIPIDRLARALNGELPDDVVVKAVAEAPAGFHARFSATARTYRYVVLNRPAPSALLGRYALHVRDPLDIERMRVVAAELTGTRDWATFGLPHAPGRSTVRRVSWLDVRPWKDCVLVTVQGNAFLRSQVRAFVGALLLSGRRKVNAAEVAALRDSRDPACIPPLAAAKGLYLVRVSYDGRRLTGDPTRDAAGESRAAGDDEDEDSAGSPATTDDE
jgi:tRNA pseudouridine38-40 synthase